MSFSNGENFVSAVSSLKINYKFIYTFISLSDGEFAKNSNSKFAKT